MLREWWLQYVALSRFRRSVENSAALGRPGGFSAKIEPCEVSNRHEDGECHRGCLRISHSRKRETPRLTPSWYGCRLVIGCSSFGASPEEWHPDGCRAIHGPTGLSLPPADALFGLRSTTSPHTVSMLMEPNAKPTPTRRVWGPMCLYIDSCQCYSLTIMMLSDPSISSPSYVSPVSTASVAPVSRLRFSVST